MKADSPRRVHIGPGPLPLLEEAVSVAGCLRSPLADAEAVVWFGRDPEELVPHLPSSIAWLQLPDAGVDRWLAAGVHAPNRVVTSARGVYGHQVAEHAVALLLACTRRTAEAARRDEWAPDDLRGRVLAGLTVTVVGGGDIGRALLRMLMPFDCRVVVVNRRGEAIEGAALTLPSARLHEALRQSDAVVLAAPSTPETKGMLDAAALSCMRASSIVVNVARGDLLVAEALLRALNDGPLAAAALDVTDPEPLPPGHPLWWHSRVLITPHTANPPEVKLRSFARRVRENCMRFAQNEPLVSVVEEDGGY